jgi:hypothetical protein
VAGANTERHRSRHLRRYDCALARFLPVFSPHVHVVQRVLCAAAPARGAVEDGGDVPQAAGHGGVGLVVPRRVLDGLQAHEGEAALVGEVAPLDAVGVDRLRVVAVVLVEVL